MVRQRVTGTGANLRGLLGRSDPSGQPGGSVLAGGAVGSPRAFCACCSSAGLIPAPPTEIREAFKVFDRDGNGFISKQELGTAMRSLGYMPNEVELEVIIQRLDMDGRTPATRDEDGTGPPAGTNTQFSHISTPHAGDNTGCGMSLPQAHSSSSSLPLQLCLGRFKAPGSLWDR